MKRKSESKETSVKKVGSGKVAPVQDTAAEMTDEDVARLIETTARSLLAKPLMKTERDLWVRRARIIMAYAARFQPDGKFHRPDPFVRLAAYPGIPWSANQLRAYVQAVELMDSLGKDAPDAPITTYALVSASKADMGVKRSLLKEAVDEDLTTREVKRKLSELKGDGDESADEKSILGDWNRLGSAADKVCEELAKIEAEPPAMSDLGVVNKLKDLAEKLQVFLAPFNKG